MPTAAYWFGSTEVVADLARVFDDLVRVETVVWNAVDARLRAEHDLTLARFEIMQVIDRTPACRVVDIAGELAIGWAGASKIVDRVEAAGHCKRRPNPNDARSSLISLTGRGRALLRRAGVSFTAEVRLRLAAALTPVELENLGNALAQVRTNSTEPPARSLREGQGVV